MHTFKLKLDLVEMKEQTWAYSNGGNRANIYEIKLRNKQKNLPSFPSRIRLFLFKLK